MLGDRVSSVFTSSPIADKSSDRVINIANNLQDTYWENGVVEDRIEEEGKNVNSSLFILGQ